MANVPPNVTRSSSNNYSENSTFDNRNFIVYRITQYFTQKNNTTNNHEPTDIEINPQNQSLREFILEVLNTIGFYGMRYGVISGTFTLLREGAFEEAKAFSIFSVTCLFVDKIFDKAFWQQIQSESFSKLHY